MMLSQPLQRLWSTHSLDLRMTSTHGDEPNITLRGIVWSIKFSARLQDDDSDRIYRGIGARFSFDIFFLVLASIREYIWRWPHSRKERLSMHRSRMCCITRTARSLSPWQPKPFRRCWQSRLLLSYAHFYSQSFTPSNGRSQDTSKNGLSVIN
jgi:hypothetical protein